MTRALREIMMNSRNTVALGLALLVLAGGALGADKDLHIPAGRSVGWNWYVTDGAGFRWDINSYGTVNDGTNDAYDGGMQLQVNGSSYSWGSSGKLNKAGDEVEIGPWSRGSVKIYRRIYIDKKGGYCRWIDIFENTATSTQTLTLRYYSNMGGSTRYVYTATGQPNVTDKDWGCVTAYSTGSTSRPCVAHVWATKGTKPANKPRFQYSKNNDSLYYHMTLKIPAKRTVALCLFEAQRRPYSAAQKFIKEFRPDREIQKIPPALRRILINMGGITLTLGSLELQRHEKHDLAVLRNSDELLGTIQNTNFVVETFYGKLDLPAEKVIGISASATGDSHVQVGLVDGQVLAGKFVNAPLKLKLVNGDEMSLPMAKLKTAAFRLSTTRPSEIPIRSPAIVLRSGQQLFFKPADLEPTFHTEYGDIKLNTDDLRNVHFDTAGGGLHRAVFRNGSVLSGLLEAEELSLGLALGPKLTIPRHLAHRLAFPGAAHDTAKLATVTLRNEDVLYGRIVDESLAVQTRFGKVTVTPATIQSMTFRPGMVGPVLIKLHNGTTVSGKLLPETINIQIAPGPKLPVFVGHITGITCPKPTTAVGGGTTPKPPTPTPASNANIEKLRAQIKEAEARLAKMQAVKKQLAAAANTPATQKQREVLAATIAKSMAQLDALKKQLAVAMQAAAKAAPRKPVPAPAPSPPEAVRPVPAVRRLERS